MTLLANMQAVSNRLLTDKGESVSFSRQTGGAFDPILGAYSGASTTSFSGYAHPSPYKLGEVDGTVVQMGDIRLLVEYMSTAPEQGDGCAFRAEDYKVMSVMPISVQGGDAAYKVQLRK